MSDPLSLLREQFRNNKNVVAHDDTHITIGDLKFPRNTPTPYKRDRGRGESYPLEALYYLLIKPQLAGAAKTRAYNDECKMHNFAKVLMADQKDVIAYLTFKQETSQYLVSAEELTTLAVPQTQDVPVSAKGADKAAGEKRKRDEPVLDMTDENMIKSKAELAERLNGMAMKPLQGPEEKKKARIPINTDDVTITTAPYILADAPVTRALLGVERSHLTRTTVLDTASDKDFKKLHDILHSALRKDKGKAKGEVANNRPSNAQPAAARRDRYNVSGVEAFKAAGMDADLMQAEQQGSSLLSSTQNQPAAGKGSEGNANKVSKLGSMANLEPIIIVPQAASASITKWNVKDLLEKGQYRTREDQKKAAYKPEERVSVMHQEEGPSGTHTYHYKVVDSADNMKKDDWQRVVAVFIQGPEWQFKQWDLSSFGGKMVNMFHKVKRCTSSTYFTSLYFTSLTLLCWTKHKRCAGSTSSSTPFWADNFFSKKKNRCAGSTSSSTRSSRTTTPRSLR